MKPIYDLPCNLYRCLSKALISYYGLDGWKAKTLRKNQIYYYFALGYCDHQRQVIWLNYDRLRRYSFNFVQGTIKHELAHAITGEGHTPRWKAQCIKMGIKGRVHGVSPPKRKLSTN